MDFLHNVHMITSMGVNSPFCCFGGDPIMIPVWHPLMTMFAKLQTPGLQTGILLNLSMKC